MIREYVTSLPVAVGTVRWPAELRRVTLVVKMRLQLSVTGELVPVGPNDIDALSLDSVDERGELLYPSDFAPYKVSCDFFVAGPSALDRAGGGHIAVGTIERRCQPREALGPLENFCRDGDPTEPAAERVWSSGRIDFSRFQSVPPSQRLPFPRAPFVIRYMRSASRLSARYVGPEPRARLIDPTIAGADTLVPLALDTIAIRPDQYGMTLVFRGVGIPRTFNETVVIDRGEGIDLTRAHRFRLVEPSMLTAADSAPSQTITSTQGPFRQTAMTMDPARHIGAALPFVASQAPSSRNFLDDRPAPAITPRDFAQLRESAPNVADAHDALSGTVALRADDVWRSPAAPPNAPPPTAPIASAWSSGAPSRVDMPQTVGTALVATPAATRTNDEPSVSVASARSAPTASKPAAPSAEAELDAKLAQIQKEVWKGEKPLADILAAHGMTELEWRAQKRARSGRR